jgi:hypothetical protein
VSDEAREPSAAEKDLARARALYEAGDYALLREVAGPLAKSEDAAVRAGAEDLLRKVEVDPFAKWAGVATLLVLAAVTYWYVVR